MKAKVELALGWTLDRVLRIGNGHVIETDWTGFDGTVAVGFIHNNHGSACSCGLEGILQRRPPGAGAGGL